MKKILFFLLLLSANHFSFSQNQKLTIEDAVMKQRTTLAPERLNQLQWVKGTAMYAFIKKENDTEMLTLVDINKKKETNQTIPLSAINKVMKENKLDTLSRYPMFDQFNNSFFQFKQKNTVVRVDWANNKLLDKLVYDDKAENADQSTISGHVAYTIENNLFIKTKTGKTVQISKDGNDGLVYGKTVHRDEYGISKGTYWSTKGNKLAFYRMDQSMVTDYPIMNLDEHPAKARNIKYPMAGMPSHQVTIGIYDVVTDKIIYLQIEGPKDQYLTNIAWSGDEKTIFVAVLNRETNHMWLNQYDAFTGSKIKTLFEETNDAWVEPLHPIQFLKNNSTQFIWQSQRSGHNHIYLYDWNGAQIKQLTKGDWDVLDVTNITDDNIYFTSTISSPLDVQFCSVDLKTNTVQQLTHEAGVHVSLFNETNGNYIDQYTNTTTPRIINWYDAKNKLVKNILTASNPLKNYSLGKIKMLTLTAADGKTTLYGRMILPPNFDSTKKYPCVTYVYNGPHVQLVTNAWLGGADMWNYYMAQEGYIMFTIDGRGSGNRGFDFEKGIHRQLGTEELADQMVGNTYLRGLKYVDTSRMGIHGWSFGGFMTTSLITRTPGKYKVGVCGGPVIDWSYYEVMYTERYMDTPEENPEGFKNSNLLNYVDKLQGKLLMIHGTADDVVVWQNSLLYVKKCVEKGKQLDYFVYPGHLHNVIGKDRVHLMTKITEYFKTNL